MDAKSINILVAENLTKQGSQKVVDTVVDVLVQKEVTRRADALTAALKLHDDARKELLKFKADVVNYNEDGSVASSTWSKAKLDEKKKTTEKMEKIERSIVKATEKDDWSDLYNLKGGGDNKPTDGKPSETKADDTKSNN